MSTTRTHRRTRRRPLIPVLAIALGSFAVVVAEFVPVGALTAISSGLHISDGSAGLLVTVPALVGAVAAPAAALLIRRVDRRTVIIGLTGLIVISCATSALAPNFAVLVASRALLGVSVGGVWATAVSASSQLVPERLAHTASSMVFGAIAVGSVVTVPSATLVAATFDWRWTFAGAATVAACALVVQAILIPALPTAKRLLFADLRTLLRSHAAIAILAIVFLVVFAQFSAFTYVVPFLTGVTTLEPGAVSLLVLTYGALTIAGNFGGGALLGRNLRGTVIATLAAGFAGLTGLALGGSLLIVAVTGLIAWGLAWGNAPVALQHWLYTLGRGRFATEAVNATFTSVVQIGVAAGSLVGGTAVDLFGPRSNMTIGGAAAAIGLILGLGLLIATRARAAPVVSPEGLADVSSTLHQELGSPAPSDY